VECYLNTRAAYETAEAAVRLEEIDRKNEYRGLLRMLCLITAFEDGQITDLEITTCRTTDHTAAADEKLTINYFTIPDIEECHVTDYYPGNEVYVEAEFVPLPATAKGDPTANHCSGLVVISTEPDPHSYSPDTCACERVTLNGHFSPGALVVCTNCNEVSKTTDAISCPHGTKLFAPASQGDWDTFINSVSEFARNPHFIVDVTRPLDGCGGCTTEAMNSANVNQASWVTQDGSPWWLAATAKSEPNGDYTANCYLGITTDPASSNAITFNDGSCAYKSADYYCQTVPINLTPQPSSPEGCTCSVVTLTGDFSARFLLKCVNCLDVSKSTQENSCPTGTKLWAPKDAQDWKTFLDSATELRDPYWIVDVTAPVNGCGGCTSNPMNSGNAAQAQWQTTDEQEWWLRGEGTTYSEPNGDYEANCYLDLWHTVPATENDVKFNDWNCKYNSKSYYCQGEGVRPVTTTTTTTTEAAMIVSTEPASGSPSSCTCVQLTLKGTYSAGAITKCTECNQVYRSTDENSCPEGQKIFSPATKEDWQTFFDSDGEPLYAPHWIIDVTHPANGCGGCTSNAMNSNNANQNMWTTEDGSAWWFRDDTYSEPNGDYTANCYLDLWSSPKTADNIIWNDGNCNYEQPEDCR